MNYISKYLHEYILMMDNILFVGVLSNQQIYASRNYKRYRLF
jgi:hypothetical protein